ncbi:hypothetical protein [Candidatus Electronema sp. TJ]|uniref:hypothetical protein n=1 Tax=Candidatus Electronema sp. TJ TaxID=3401573 RepID=UPI003AA8A876
MPSSRMKGRIQPASSSRSGAVSALRKGTAAPMLIISVTIETSIRSRSRSS